MRIPKWVWWTIGALALFFFALPFLMSHFLPEKLTRLIEAEISEALENKGVVLYDVTLNELTISSGFGAIEINQLSIHPKRKTAGFDPAQLPGQLFDVDMFGIRLSTQVLINAALGAQKIQVNELGIDSLILVYYQNLETGDTIPESKKGDLDKLTLKNLSVNYFNLKYHSWGDSADAIAAFDQGNLTAAFELHFLPEGKMSVVTQALNVAIEALNYQPKGELYTFSLSDFQIEGERVIATGFRCDPRYDKKEFQKYLEWQSDRIETAIDTIKVSGLDVNTLLNEKTLIANNVTLSGTDIEAFRDRAVPFDTSRRPAMPTRLLRQLPFNVWVSSLTLDQMHITYLELPKESQVPGEVKFTNLQAEAKTITNIPDSLARDSMLVIDAKALLYGEATISAIFRYNLQDIRGGFSIDGQLAPMELTKVNTAVKPLSGMEILKGKHESSRIVFSGNDISATGSLQMLYSGLEVEMEPDRGKLRRAIANWTSRKLVYHGDNPKNGKERTGRIEFHRATDRFVFNFWWKCYLSGIKDITLRNGAAQAL